MDAGGSPDYIYKLKQNKMKNEAQILLDDIMVIYVENEFTHAGIEYTTDKRVMDNGDIVTCITFDGCDPYVGNYLFHAGATFFRETLSAPKNPYKF